MAKKTNPLIFLSKIGLTGRKEMRVVCGDAENEHPIILPIEAYPLTLVLSPKGRGKEEKLNVKRGKE